MAKHLTDATFESEVLSRADGKPVLVDFFATWCGPCQRMSPFIEKLASTQDKLAVVKVDVDQCPGISESQHIEAMPTLRIFANGKKVLEQVGAFRTEEELRNWASHYL